jgi:hypothetical protein
VKVCVLAFGHTVAAVPEALFANLLRDTKESIALAFAWRKECTPKGERCRFYDGVGTVRIVVPKIASQMVRPKECSLL